MICKQILAFSLVAVLLSACDSGKSKENKPKDTPSAEKHEPLSSKEKPASSEKSEDTLNDENIFRHYDAVKKILKKWNQAINEHQLSDLENLYADEVSYYSKKSSKQGVLTQKSDWLKKHPSYKQELGYTDVYFDEDDIQEVEEAVLKVEFVAQFTKICIENGKKTEIESYLYFRKFGKEWKIVRETDALTEVNVAKKKPVFNLPEGRYNYYFGQWSDTRDIHGFAHDMVPYSADLYFTMADGKITGIYDYYSGTARSHTYYLIKSGKVANGILELEMVYSEVDIPWADDMDINIDDFDEADLSKETKTWRLKILENKQLVCLSKECSAYSRTLKRIK